MASFVEFVKRSWQLLKSKDTPWFYKLIPFLALIYIVWPADAVADIVPLLGQLDDAGILAGLMSLFVWLTERKGMRVPKLDSTSHTSKNVTKPPNAEFSEVKPLDENESDS